jgi:hypothetical protein
MSNRSRNSGIQKPAKLPVIVTDFDDVCSRLFEDGELGLNSKCIRLLRVCIFEDDCCGKRSCFELFSNRLNQHPDRFMLLSEIVGSWYHTNYKFFRDPDWSDSKRDNCEPALLLRER